MKRILILLFSLVLALPLLWAQETPDFLQLSGVVTDRSTGKPLHYASIDLTGTHVSNVTNAEGVFSLKVDSRTLPESLVTVSHLGYATMTLKVSDFDGHNLDNPLEISLLPITLTLDPALIRAYDPEELLLAAIYRIKQNYPDKHVGMTAFYRELIRKGTKKYLTMNEAILDIDKAPYGSFQNDRIGIYKGRGSQNYDATDTLFIKYQGGVSAIMQIDQVKDPFAAVYPNEIRTSYDFKMETSEYQGDKLFYVISFNQKPQVERILMRGRVYIDSESLAIGRVEMNMNVEGRSDAADIFVLKRPADTHFDVESASYIVNFKQFDDKWYYDYAKVELKFSTRKKKSLFRNHYSVMSEIAITDHLETPRKINDEARVKFRDQMTEKVSAFTDEDFWENYNVIEPDAQIEAIIRRIVRQLKKHNLE